MKECKIKGALPYGNEGRFVLCPFITFGGKLCGLPEGETCCDQTEHEEKESIDD